ncbi:Oidioi.mRNA.OKI2018_I69.XSR.g17024.t1.cds [Oikopleura dioica]|uniref:Oidioi.mRNA.OKI2018_I69.XSR.g17024.t1.cds n=1 Tax=Oikopleura dioica TaxID=34765 RepID=A0ABN7SHX2_OIKDI|nr:Oidioi.mRNA.OKI2018_I69.XSR.g17024.t1.cds [Oikopleura dioica]
MEVQSQRKEQDVKREIEVVQHPRDKIKASRKTYKVMYEKLLDQLLRTQPGRFHSHCNGLLWAIGNNEDGAPKYSANRLKSIMDKSPDVDYDHNLRKEIEAGAERNNSEDFVIDHNTFDYYARYEDGDFNVLYIRRTAKGGEQPFPDYDTRDYSDDSDDNFFQSDDDISEDSDKTVSVRIGEPDESESSCNCGNIFLEGNDTDSEYSDESTDDDCEDGTDDDISCERLETAEADADATVKATKVYTHAQDKVQFRRTPNNPHVIDDGGFCQICQVQVGQRAKHCRSCNKCVQDFGITSAVGVFGQLDSVYSPLYGALARSGEITLAVFSFLFALISLPVIYEVGDLLHYHFKLRKLGLTTFQLIKLGNARKNDDSFDFSKQEKFKLRKIEKLYKKLGRWFFSLQDFVSSE